MSRAKKAQPVPETVAADQIYLPEYLVSSKGNELLKRIGHVFQVLVKMDQVEPEDMPPGMENVAAQLIHSSIISSPSKEVKLLCCCCLVEILRIYAPTPPFDNKQLKGVFRAIAEQFEYLSPQDGSEALYERAFHIVESLATVRSCCILVELSQEMDDPEDPNNQINHMFRKLLASLPHPAAKKLEDNVAEILTAMLEEMSELSSNTLELLLGCLAEREQKPTAANVVAAVLRRCEEKLCIPVANAVSHFLSLSHAADSTHIHMTQHEYLHRVIVETVQVIPSVLLLLFPRLSRDLDAEDVSVRRAAVSITGHTFALPTLISASEGSLSGRLPIAKAFDVHFQGWTRRFRDREPTIRLDMCSLAGEVMRAHTSLSDTLLTEIVGRLTDLDDNVRRRAVVVCCDAACLNLCDSTKQLLINVAQRTKDRNIEIRREAATGLAQVFAAHVQSHWGESIVHLPALPTSAALGAPAFGSASDRPSAKFLRVRTALDWVPSAIIECYDQGEVEMKSRVIQLLENVVWPTSLDNLVRAFGFVHVFSTLTDAARRAFDSICADRKAFQGLIHNFLRCRAGLKGSATTKKSELAPTSAAEEHARLCLVISEKLGNKAKTLPLMHSLSTSVADNRIFKQLAVLSDPAVPLSEISKAKEDLFARAKSLTAAGGSSEKASTADMKALGELIKSLARRMTLTFAHPEALSDVVHVTLAAYYRGQLEGAEQGMHLLNILSRHFPEMFPWLGTNDHISTRGLATMLGSEYEQIVIHNCKILDNLGSDSFQETFDAETRHWMRAAFIKLASEAPPKTAKWATMAACKVFMTHAEDSFQDDPFFQFFEDYLHVRSPLTSSELRDDPHCVSILASLRALASCAPSSFTKLDTVDSRRDALGETVRDGGFCGRITAPVFELVQEEATAEIIGSDTARETPGAKRRRPRNSAAPPSKSNTSPAAKDGFAQLRDDGCCSIMNTKVSRATYMRVVSLKLLSAVSVGISKQMLADRDDSDSICNAAVLANKFLGSAKAAISLACDVLRACGGHSGKSSRSMLLEPAQLTPGGRRRSPARRIAESEDDDTPVEDASHDTSISSEEAAIVRLVAARCVTKICSTAVGRTMDNRLLSPQDWVAVALTCIDKSPLVRQGMADTLCKRAKKVELPFRHLTAFMLVALEPRAPQRKQVRELLPMVLALYRRAAASSSSSFMVMPEYILPFAAFLLASEQSRLPPPSKAKALLSFQKPASGADGESSVTSDTPERKDDLGPFAEHAACFSYILEALIASFASTSSSKAQVSGSISMMFAILRKVRDCVNAVDTSATWATQAMADVCFMSLKKFAKDSACFEDYPGEIRLPASIFRAAASTVTAPDRGKGVPASASRVARARLEGPGEAGTKLLARRDPESNVMKDSFKESSSAVTLKSTDVGAAAPQKAKPKARKPRL